MTAQKLDNEFKKYYSLLNSSQKEIIINLLKAFVHPKEFDEPVNIEEYNIEIDEAMEEIKRGESYSHEEVVKISKKW